MQLFISYNSIDRTSVVAVQKLLQARGITTFLDRDNLEFGLPWPQALEQALRAVDGVTVFIGRELGGWQKREMWFALDRQVCEEQQGHVFPVIPVLLQGADLMPGFLFLNTWIDLRCGLDGVVTGEALDAFERAIRSTKPVRDYGNSAARATERAATICPYRGLQVFREEDAAFFAGRKVLAEQLLDFTLSKNLVAVVGPSGSGKSSVVQAGLLPLLRREQPPADTWDAVSFTPGHDPFHQLASALIPLLEPDLSETARLVDAEELGRNLAAERIRVEAVINRVIRKSNGTGRLLLVADQFEELFTLTPEQGRRPFAQALLHALGSAPVTLLVTLRADFYSQIITLDRGLSDVLAPAQVNIGALTPDELRESITAPAELVGLEFEPGLVDRILTDVGSEPGRLPLTEFALAELWQRREGRRLTNGAYNKIGGVPGALARRTEAEFARLNPEEQTAAQRLFSRLVRVAKPEEAGEDTRQRTELSEADTLAKRVAKRLADARLLVIGSEASTGTILVEVAHEALIRNWERLRGWLNEDREFLLWRQRLQTQARDWLEHGQDPGYLLRGAPLSEAERWLLGRPQDLTDSGQRLILESITLREGERQEEGRRRQAEIENARRLQEAAEAKAKVEQERAAEQARRAMVLWQSSLALAALLLLALGASVFALWQRAVAEDQARIAESRQAEAQNSEARNLWQQARGQTDPLLSLHLMAEAAARAADRRLQNAIALDHVQRQEATRLLASWDADCDPRQFAVLLPNNHTAIVWSGWNLKLFDLANSSPPPKELIASGRYTGARFSPSGTRVLLWTKDGDAEIADPATGRITGPRVKQGAVINHADFTPDERAFFTADAMGNVRLWKTADGSQLGHAGPVDTTERAYAEKVAVSPDGRQALIITRHRDDIDSSYYVSRLWDLETQEILAQHNPRLTEPGANLGTNGVFSDDGRRLLTWDEEAAWILDVHGGMKRMLEMKHSDKVQGALFDGNRVVTWTNSHVRIWDLSSFQTPKELHALSFVEGVRGVAIEKTHRVITAWASDGTIRAWALDNGTPKETSFRHRAAAEAQNTTRWESDYDRVDRVRLSPSGNRLLSWINDTSVHIWDRVAGREAAPALSHRDSVLGAAFASDDTKVLTWSSDGVLRFWAIETSVSLPRQQLWTASFGADGWQPSMGVQGRTLNEDPNRRLVWGDDGIVTIWDIATGSQVAKSAVLSEAHSALIEAQKAGAVAGPSDRSGPHVAFDRQGTCLVVYGNTEPSLAAKLWDLKSGRALATIGNPGHVTFNREGTFFATWNEEGRLTLRRSSDGQPVGKEVSLLTMHKDNPVKSVEDIVINATGNRLAVVYQDDGDGDPSVRIWAVDTGQYIGSDINPVTALQFSPRGDRLALWRNILRGGDERSNPSAVLVDATTGSVISDLKIGMDEWVVSSLFDRRGRWFFGSTGVWNATNGEPVRGDVVAGSANGENRYVVFRLDTGNAEIIDTDANRSSGIVLSHGAVLKDVLMAGATAATLGDDVMKLWSLDTGKLLGSPITLDANERVDGFLVSARGDLVLTWDELSDLARLRDLKSGHQIGATMQHGGDLKGAALNADLALIVTWGSQVRLWDIILCEPLRFSLYDDDHNRAAGALFLPGGSLLVWHGSEGFLWDLAGLLQPDANFHRTRISALTGVEYDTHSRRLHVLATEDWKRRVEEYDRRSAGTTSTRSFGSK
jgi:WD40 repeat protein